MADSARGEVLVGTEWVERHLADPSVRLVEVDVDTDSYYDGHIPGAVGWSWTSQLCDPVQRDIVPKDAFEALMSKSGIANDTTVVLYGDNNNWFAAWAFWQMKVYGHADVRLMDGGRLAWLAQERGLEDGEPTPEPTTYRAGGPDNSIRAFLPQVSSAVEASSAELVDVRSPEEFSGEILAPPGLPETCQRGGHIPGASNVPWGKACNQDGTFKGTDELRAVYAEAGITGTKPIVAYCRIGERSSHTWFVLKYLLGHDDVRNYDGSWTEWGNLVGMPVARGA